MGNGDWVKELPAEIMVCNPAGIVLEMNAGADLCFAEDGGHRLIGTNILACHPQPELDKLTGMLETRITNTYINTENGEQRFFFQSPWFRDGHYAGFVEISFEVPEEIPNFTRE